MLVLRVIWNLLLVGGERESNSKESHSIFTYLTALVSFLLPFSILEFSSILQKITKFSWLKVKGL